MSSTHSLSKSAEALSAIILNPRVSKEAKHSTLNRMDGIRPRSEPSASASSSRARSRSRERSRGSEYPVHRRLRNPLHRLVALFVGEKIPEVHRVTERGIPTQHAREDPRSVQSRSREVHTSQKPRQVQERHPHHSHSHREHDAHETRRHREHRPRHEDQPRPHRHEREHEHRHRHRENHVHFVDEERPARIVAQQKALVLGERGVRLTERRTHLFILSPDSNASSRERRRAADFLEFHGESVV